LIKCDFYEKGAGEMEVGYVVKGKWLGENWRSEIYEDAEDCNNTYWKKVEDKDYSDLNEFTVYMHFEEITNI
jgi:hypothetical protein